jgi:hypothetical protein
MQEEKMPIVSYFNRVEPREDAVIWRFMDLRKFRDLMASQELYFRRADLFTDKSEGLPPDQYARRVLGLNPHDINDCVTLNNHLGFLAQNRESYYITCWHLYRQETLDMWEQYGDDGVAVCSRYGLLKSALDGLLDDVCAGLVRYGTDHLADTFNALEFITTKQIQYSQDCEVRAWLTVMDPLSGGNRHFDLNNAPHPAPLALNPRNSWVPECKRRRIDLRSVITEIFISPWAEQDEVEEIKLWAKPKAFPLKHSELTSDQTPTLEQFRALRHLAGTRIPEPEAIEKHPAKKVELDQFFEELSGLTPSRVRFLYRQRWEACRLNPGELPQVADVQYLETTLRVLDAWRRAEIQEGE